jgi:hypothetical protein
VIPNSFHPVIEVAATQGNDGICAAHCPEHTGLLESGADHRFARGFNDTGTDKQVLSAELGITHSLGVVLEVSRLDAKDFGERRRGCTETSQKQNQLLDPAAIELRLMTQYPLLLTRDVAGVDQPGYIPKVLTGMKQIDDLDSTRKV